MTAANSEAASALRQKAEELLKRKPTITASSLSEVDLLKFVHELEVHQRELELQNEELIQALSTSQDAIKLYDIAPAGYFTLSKDYEIIELNLSAAKMLGKERSLLIKGRFDYFISKDTKADCHIFLEKVFNNLSVETCEVTLASDSEFPLYVLLTGIVTTNGEHCLLSMVDITGRKKDQEILQKSMSLTEATLESIHDGILVVSRDGTVIKSNAQFAELWRIPDHILSSSDDKSLLDFILEQLSDPEGFIDKVTEMYSNPEEKSFDLIQFKDGRVFERISKPMIIAGQPTGRVWSFHDITRRMKAINALHESEAIYRNLVLKLPDGLYKSTHEGKFVDVNPAMVSMLGYDSKEELMSLDIKTQLYFEPQDRESKFLDDNLEEVGVYRLKKKDGSAIWVEDKGWYNLDEKGNVLSHEGIMRDITQRKRAEELLHFSEERYRTIVDNIGEGVGLVNPEDQFEFANIAAEKIFGVGPGGLVGMDLNQFVTQDQYELIRKQTSLRKKGIKSVYELDIQRPNKDVRTIIVTAVPLINKEKCFVGTYGVFRDITERKRAEKALRYEQYLLHTLMNNVPDHIYFKDCQSRFIRINNAQARLFGLSDPAQALGKTDFDFFTIEHARQAYDDEQEIIRTGKPISKEEKETWEDLPDTWVLTTKMPLIDADNKIIGTFGISMNIDQRKKAEAEIQLKNDELHSINAEKDKFFSIIAHDLRSPFNGFLGLTEMMAEELSTMTMEDIQKFALILRTSATNLYSLLGNLLEWSSMQRGLTTYFPTTLLLMPKISESMVFVMEGANNKKIDVLYDVPFDLEVYADRNMLGGIIRNLVSNAIKFTPHGGRIIISAKCDTDKSVEVSIEDNGIGMNENILSHLFNLDVNTSRNGTNGEHSTGLGLIICKDFIEKHGGKLWVKSREGKGSIFSFTLPPKK